MGFAQPASANLLRPLRGDLHARGSALGAARLVRGQALVLVHPQDNHPSKKPQPTPSVIVRMEKNEEKHMNSQAHSQPSSQSLGLGHRGLPHLERG